jgi:uncharacterized protein YegP (UPF0339 family)
MSEFPSVIYVDVKKSSIARVLRRPQPYYWIARSADNQKVLARSSERYTNYADVLHAIDLLFAAGTTVYRRESEKGNVPVRMAA